MKPLLSYRHIFAVLVVLTLAQFACSAGGQAASTGGAQQPQPTSAAQVTQPPQATQPPAAQSEHGTQDEAKAMLQKAIEHYKTVGREQALKDFNGRVAPFFDRDLYVVCMGADHIETANGGFPQYVGVSGDSLIDNNGVPVGKAVWDSATTDSVGSVDYHWTNPVNGQTEPKRLFFQKVGNEVCGVGAYNP